SSPFTECTGRSGDRVGCQPVRYQAVEPSKIGGGLLGSHEKPDPQVVAAEEFRERAAGPEPGAVGPEHGRGLRELTERLVDEEGAGAGGPLKKPAPIPKVAFGVPGLGDHRQPGLLGPRRK